MGALEGILVRVTEGLAAGGDLLVLTDYDGTLTPLVENPAHARLGRGVRGVLRALAQSSRARVAVLSGRTLADLRGRVGVPEAIYAGCHGLEIEGPGVAFLHPEATARRRVLQAVVRDLRRRTATMPDVRVEAKGLAVAVHYRALIPGSVAHLRSAVEGAVKGSGKALEILPGKNVIEVLPRVGWNKGACARWILDRVGPALLPPVSILYLGDDRTDETAFDALAGRAITAKVGSDGDRSRAEYRLSEVAYVRQLLVALAAMVKGGVRWRL